MILTVLLYAMLVGFTVVAIGAGALVAVYLIGLGLQALEALTGSDEDEHWERSYPMSAGQRARAEIRDLPAVRR